MSSSDILGFLTNTNADYLSDIYTRYLSDPSSVDESWKRLFDGLDDDMRSLMRDVAGASWNKGLAPLVVDTPANENAKEEKKAVKIDDRAIQDSLRAYRLVDAYRIRGHLLADIDPLGMREKNTHPELQPEHYGFSMADYDRPIYMNGLMGLDVATLREIIDACQKTYCGRIGVEYTHMLDPEEKSWIRERVEEGLNRTQFSDEGKKAILQSLTRAEGFELFLHVKYPGTKRFGIDGGEAMVPAIEQILKRGGQLGLKEIAIGMPHRGRLNILTNVMGKTFTSMFSLFMGKSDNPEGVLASGDVKYHLGASSDRDFDGNEIHLSLNTNPSHLEVVDPVVEGKVKAKQIQRGGDDKAQKEVLPLLLHGDAAFAGQGVVAETFLFSGVEGYNTGGTIHFIVNNQIGFTTKPEESRSGFYCTDIAKAAHAPVFHVNGDDPEAVVHVARMAIEYRQRFGKDVVVDMYCYRRNGHNEGDEPMFTSPLMYQKIKKHQTTRQLYASLLEREGVLSGDEDKAMKDEFSSQLEKEFKAAEDYKPNSADTLDGRWSDIKLAENKGARRGQTALTDDMVTLLREGLATLPEGFNVNSKIARQLEQKKEMFETGQGFDWGTAEAMAFGSLLLEDIPVRLSGQDCQRGTFSHRHSVLHDQKNDTLYTPLNNLKEGQARYDVYNSPLSELGVLGFEYGYSSAEPHALVIWEAQFGDFANGAQMMIDQFISSGETKWLRMSGLTMLLPHGYEGQGPEHSSARPERFLQMCGEDNWQVVNCTTPANIFHVLRRQVKRDFRKPLIVFTPKSLLRHKRCVSSLDMMTGDQTFHRVLHDEVLPKNPKKVKRVILCTGKVYYDLLEASENRQLQDEITIVRLEQLYPFPDDKLAEELGKYPNAEVFWVQEEPENQGCWHFVDRRIESVLTTLKHKAKRPHFVGREASASPATGLLSVHLSQQKQLIDEALTL